MSAGGRVVGEQPISGETFRERLPVPVLRRYVACVWVQQVPHGSTGYAHRSFPTGSAELVCEVGAVPEVVGPQTGPVEETLTPGATVVGVRFRPGAAVPILGVPASELVDLTVPAAHLWATSPNELGEKIGAAASREDAAATLEAEVMARLADMSHPDPVAVDVARRLLPGCTGDVAALALALDISERQLRRRCEAAIGLAPKVLHRILRFRGFLALARQHGHQHMSLALLAAEAGYFDQSHLSRECVRLTGWSPRALLREAEQHCGAVHDHAASYAPLLRSLAAGRAGSTAHQ